MWMVPTGMFARGIPYHKLLQLTGLSFDHIWAGTTTDVGANPNGYDSKLILSNATEDNAASGLVPGNGLSEKQFEFQAEQGHARAYNDARVGDMAVSTIAISVTRGTATRPTTSFTIIGKRSDADGLKGWTLSQITTTGKFQVFYDEGPGSKADISPTPDWYDGWTVSVVYYDKVNDLSCFATSVSEGTALGANTKDVASTSTHFSIGRSEVAGTDPSMTIALAALAEGSQCDGLTAAQVKAMADSIANQMVTQNVKTELFKLTHVAWQGIYAGNTTDLGEKAHNLTLNGATENNATTGLVAGNGVSEVSINLTADSGDNAMASDTDICAATGSMLFMQLFKSAADTTAIFSASRTSVSEGWQLYQSSGADNILYYKSGTGAFGLVTLDGAVDDGEWHCAVGLIDTTAENIEYENDLDDNPVVVVSGTQVSPELFRIGSYTDSTTPPCETALFAWRRDTDVEGTDLGALSANVMAGMVTQMFPATESEWADSYPSVATPEHGWVLDTGALPIPDNFGSVPLDVGVNSPDLSASWNGRGGGLCYAPVSTDSITTTLTDFFDVGTGDFSIFLSWYRAGELGTGNKELWEKRNAGAAAGISIIERPVNDDFICGINNGTVSKSIIVTGAGFDTTIDVLFTRTGTTLEAWMWYGDAPGVAQHEDGVVDAADNCSALGSVMALCPFTDDFTGSQIKAVYLWREALTRDDGDVIRRESTTSQVEA